MDLIFLHLQLEKIKYENIKNKFELELRKQNGNDSV